MKNYLGIAGFGSIRELFTSAAEPTEASHPRYDACIGPFTTRRGAEFMLRHGQNNPHCQTVADAERLARSGAPPRAARPEPRGPLMRRQIEAAIDAHPDGADYRTRAALQVGQRCPTTLRYRFDTGPRPLVLRAGGMQYRLQDNPASLAEHSAAVLHCPGWSGARTSRKALTGGAEGVMYTHPDGWSLCVRTYRHSPNDSGHTVMEPYTVAAVPAKGKRKAVPERTFSRPCSYPWWPLQVGHVTLRMDPRTLTIEGTVPASWLVDLNAGPIVDEGLVETQLELAA